MKIPCPFCERKFGDDEGEDWGDENYSKLNKHIKSPKGHGKEKCSNCGEQLSKCKDIIGTGAAFVCKRKRIRRK